MPPPDPPREAGRARFLDRPEHVIGPDCRTGVLGRQHRVPTTWVKSICRHVTGSDAYMYYGRVKYE